VTSQTELGIKQASQLNGRKLAGTTPTRNFVGTQHGDCGFRICNFLVTKVEEILAHFTARKKNAKL